MIIKSSRNNSRFIYKPEEKPAIVKEEVIPKKKKYKKPTVIVEETPTVEDVKIEEEIDLSEWLKDDINE